MRNLEPRGMGQRIVSALALLIAIGFATHVVAGWLMPLLPALVSLLIFIVLFKVVFGRR